MFPVKEKDEVVTKTWHAKFAQLTFQSRPSFGDLLRITVGHGILRQFVVVVSLEGVRAAVRRVEHGIDLWRGAQLGVRISLHWAGGCSRWIETTTAAATTGFTSVESLDSLGRIEIDML